MSLNYKNNKSTLDPEDIRNAGFATFLGTCLLLILPFAIAVLLDLFLMPKTPPARNFSDSTDFSINEVIEMLPIIDAMEGENA